MYNDFFTTLLECERVVALSKDKAASFCTKDVQMAKATLVDGLRKALERLEP